MIGDPKIKPRVCLEQGCFNYVADSKQKKCPAHLYADLMAKKKPKHYKFKKYPEKKPGNPNRPKTIQAIHTEEINKWKTKCHIIWSLIIRTVHGQGEFTKCCTCPKSKRTFGDGINGIHGGHYYEKGKYKYLAFDLRNGGPQCRNCNNNEAGEQIEMREYLIRFHGIDVVHSLERDSAEIQTKINTGLLNKYPSLDWYKEQHRILLEEKARLKIA